MADDPVALPPATILSSGLAQVDRMMADIPPGKTAAAIVEYDATGKVLRAGVAAKLGEHWKLAADIEKSFDREPPRGRLWVEWSR